MSESAFDIYQHNLDEVTRAVWEGDLDVSLLHVRLPVHMATVDADVTFTTASALRQTLAGLRESLSKLGATAYVRVAREAAFDPDDPGRITGRHVSYVLRGGTTVLPPYETRMTIALGPDGWKVIEVLSDVSNRYMTAISPEIALGHATPTPDEDGQPPANDARKGTSR